MCEVGASSLAAVNLICYFPYPYLTTILLSRKSPNNGHGKHSNRPHAIKSEYHVKMEEPIVSPDENFTFSFYCQNFLSSGINVNFLQVNEMGAQ